MVEDLAWGPQYDLEVVAREEKMMEEQAEVDQALMPNSRKIVNSCYDCVENSLPDVCTYLLQVWKIFYPF